MKKNLLFAFMSLVCYAYAVQSVATAPNATIPTPQISVVIYTQEDYTGNTIATGPIPIAIPTDYNTSVSTPLSSSQTTAQFSFFLNSASLNNLNDYSFTVSGNSSKTCWIWGREGGSNPGADTYLFMGSEAKIQANNGFFKYIQMMGRRCSGPVVTVTKKYYSPAIKGLIGSPKLKIDSFSDNNGVGRLYTDDNLKDSSLKYTCVVISPENRIENPDDMTKFSNVNCSLNKNSAGYLDFNFINFAIKDYYFAIKVEKMGDSTKPLIVAYSNVIRLVDEVQNRCSYQTKSSNDGTVCYPTSQASCPAPTASDLEITASLKEDSIGGGGTMTIAGYNKRDNDLKLRIWNRTSYLDPRPTSVVTWLENGNPVSQEWPIVDISKGYGDYLVFNLCKNDVQSESYCRLRIYYNDPNKKPLICP